MYKRLTRVQSSPDQVGQMISALSESVMPAAKQAMGYSGAALYLSRDTGQAAAATFWESAQALAASEPMGIGTRTEVAASTGAKIVDVQRFQIVLVDLAHSPRMTAYTRVDNGFTPLERLDDFANFIRDDVAPALRRRHGYRWMTTGVDRTSGLVAVTSYWDTAGDRESGGSSFLPVLQRAAEFDLNPIRIDLYEQVVLELLQPTRTES
jgi:hypothetical protein